MCIAQDDLLQVWKRKEFEVRSLITFTLLLFASCHDHGSKVTEELIGKRHRPMSSYVVFMPTGNGGMVPVTQIRPERWYAIWRVQWSDGHITEEEYSVTEGEFH